MSRFSTIKCDFCGKEKGTVNHWWQVWIDVYENMSISRTHDPRPGARDACGFQCVTQATARYLDHGTLDERKTE